MASAPIPDTLSASIAADLRQRIAGDEWSVGDRLPSEHALADHYEVSRPTIRTALQDLESRGITVTRRGVGTFITAQVSGVRADLRHLESISETIRSHGRTPGVSYRTIGIRAADDTERNVLQLSQNEEVLATDRAITADGEVVAYSRDVLPLVLLGDGFTTSDVTGSLFDLMEDRGVRAVSAVTEVQAVHDPEMGWGERPDDPTYLLLRQLHFDHDGTPVALADTYFVEGRFRWGLVRHR
ncbi:GntR family transcriptional regulator [soil metagenome]